MILIISQSRGKLKHLAKFAKRFWQVAIDQMIAPQKKRKKIRFRFFQMALKTTDFMDTQKRPPLQNQL